jgi:hypothetical protein
MQSTKQTLQKELTDMFRKNYKWYLMAETAVSPLLCFAEGDGGGEGGGPGEGGEGAGGGEGGGDSLGERMKKAGGEGGEGGSGEGGEGGNKETPPPKDGKFDMALLPENLRADSADEALPKLWEKLREYDDANVAKGKVPERAEDYQLKLEGKTAEAFPNIENDPAVGVLRKWALKQGMGASEFQNGMSELLKDLADADIIDAPLDLDKEVEALGEDGPKLYKQAEQYMDLMKTKLVGLKGEEADQMKDVVAELDLHLMTASGVKVLNWISTLTKETGTGAPGEGLGSGAPTKESVRERRRDPRNSSTSPKYDPEFRRRTDEMAKQVSGS